MKYNKPVLVRIGFKLYLFTLNGTKVTDTNTDDTSYPPVISLWYFCFEWYTNMGLIGLAIHHHLH